MSLKQALRRLLVLMITVMTVLSPASETLVRAQESGPIAPELTGLGTLHMPVTTSVTQAQRFFDQGLRLLYAFNHARRFAHFAKPPGWTLVLRWRIGDRPSGSAPT